MAYIIGIDPGPEHSGLAVLRTVNKIDNPVVERAESETDNESVAIFLDTFGCGPEDVLVVEMIESQGMAVGREVFESVYWIGRFTQAWPGRVVRVTRKAVKLTMCGTRAAKESEVRRSLLNEYGGADRAVGVKKDPGPLYGVKGHAWDAVTVAFAWWSGAESYTHGKPIKEKKR